MSYPFQALSRRSPVLASSLVVGVFVAMVGPAATGEAPARAALPLGVVPMNSASLLEAVHRGDRDLVLLLVRSEVNPDITDEAGRTLVTIARENGRPDLVEILVKASANRRANAEARHARRRVGWRPEPLFEKDALDLGLDPDPVTLKGEKAKVGIAATATRPEAGVGRLALQGVSPSELPAGDGADWMAEHLRAGGREASAPDLASDSLIEEILRDHDTKLNGPFWMPSSAMDAAGASALELTAPGAQSALLPELLESGAASGLARQDGWNSLHRAVERRDLAAMRDLLKQGADPKAMGPLGLTAVDLVLAWDCSDDYLEALLEAGADPKRTGPDGRSPIDIALAKRQFSKAKILLEHGAEAGAALTNAVVESDEATFSFLLESEIDPNGSSGDPPLLAAVRAGNVAMVTQLLGAGAATDRPGREGQPALHLAVALDRADLAELLLEAGADPNAPFVDPVSKAFLAMVREVGYIKWQFLRDSRITPLMMAADSGNHGLARILLDHGARTNVWTKRKSYYPIGFAARRDDVKMMQLLLGVDPAKEERLIKVDLSEQKAWVYDGKGNTLLTTKISSGKKGYRTKTGEFVITNKSRYHVSNIYRNAKMPYFQRLSCGDFGFHEGYCPGYAASHGCIRVPRGNASALWKITKPGDRVVIRD